METWSALERWGGSSRHLADCRWTQRVKEVFKMEYERRSIDYRAARLKCHSQTVDRSLATKTGLRFPIRSELGSPRFRGARAGEA